MILFYIIEAVAIYTVLKQHPHDADAAVHPFQTSFPEQPCCFAKVGLWGSGFAAPPV